MYYGTRKTDNGLIYQCAVFGKRSDRNNWVEDVEDIRSYEDMRHIMGDYSLERMRQQFKEYSRDEEIAAIVYYLNTARHCWELYGIEQEI